MRIGLISCSKQKLDHPAPAQELYQGQLFKLSKKWISSRCDEWAILSARYGLVMPDQVIEPYDLALSRLPRLKQQRWRDWVHEQLVDKWGEDVIYMILAGAEYRAALRQMPMVEDVIRCWTQWRIDQGMTRRRAAMGIGLIKKALKENRGYY
jgi:cytoplasmic iron level regulating protein YaaA (DUF328/UPF0246 family)